MLNRQEDIHCYIAVLKRISTFGFITVKIFGLFSFKDPKDLFQQFKAHLEVFCSAHWKLTVIFWSANFILTQKQYSQPTV